MKELYEKFYEQAPLKNVRDLLDGGDDQKVNSMVSNEEACFTDYLNFFEFLAYLQESGQIEAKDIIGLFGYYLQNLCRDAQVLKYINDDKNGFEKLSRMLKVTVKE